MAAFTLTSIHKKLYYTCTHTSLEQSGKTILVVSLRLVFEEQLKILILKIKAEQKGFQVEGILSKKTSKWIVLEHCMEYRLERITNKIEKKKKINIIFYSPAINYLFGECSYFPMLDAIHLLGFQP